MLVGWFSAKNDNITGDNLRIILDQSLQESHFSSLGTEPNDIELLSELLGETMLHVMGKGINRDTRRKYGVIKTK